jgi:small GTP-binding protein
MIPNQTIHNKIKVNLVGTTLVGKTSILSRMRFKTFNPDTITTIGGSFVTLKEGNITYEIWDTAGQERFIALIPMYFRDVNITLFVFDVTDKSSIKYINKYRDILMDQPNIKIMVLGNKTDLLKENSEHSIGELVTEVSNNFENLMLEDKLHGLHFMSALDGSGFEKFLEHFHECARTLPVNPPKNNNILIDDPYTKKDDETIEQSNRSRCC